MKIGERYKINDTTFLLTRYDVSNGIHSMTFRDSTGYCILWERMGKPKKREIMYFLSTKKKPAGMAVPSEQIQKIS